MTEQIPTIHLSKIDIAKRQLETAITLYFQRADPVSIHTLAAAAYDVLHDVCKSRGGKSIIKNTEMIRKGKNRAYLKEVNEAQNFFKHADRDPDDLHEFKPGQTAFFIWEACQMYRRLTTEMPKLFFIFDMWFTVNHTHLVTNEGDRQNIVDLGKKFSTDRVAFSKEASDAYNSLRSSELTC